MANFYQETAPSAERVMPAPPLDGNAQVDVVVVGGGVTGLSTALHLAEKGATVAVLEAEQPGWGASGRNGGQVNPGLKQDPDVIERQFGEDLGRRMNVLAGGAPGFLFDLVARLGLRCEARQQGTLRAAVHARHVPAVKAAVEQWRRRGAPVEFWEGAALARATGSHRYAGALWDRRGGDLNPLRYAQGLAQAARRAGAALHGGSRARGVEARGARWQVITATGTVTADRVVLATNGYTDDLWPGLRRSLVPLFGAIAATAPLPDPVARVILPDRPVLYESGAVTVYYRVDSAHRLLMGGRGPLREIADAAAVPHLVAYARRLWPALREVEWTHAWGGRLAVTPDSYPHVHELAPGVWACLGYNGRGVALATTLGAALAKRLVDPASPFDMPITPMKTLRLHALWPLAVRAAVARGRISDFLGI